VFQLPYYLFVRKFSIAIDISLHMQIREIAQEVAAAVSFWCGKYQPWSLGKLLLINVTK
jgi:hypothetical protein